MSSQWIDPESCQSLAVLVETVTAPLLIQHASPVCLELEIETSMPIPADARKTAELVRTLVTQSLAEMPDGGELSIGAVEVAGCVQLSLTDSGCPPSDRACSIPMTAAAIGAKLQWQPAEQGGAVVNITFTRQGESGRMAA